MKILHMLDEPYDSGLTSSALNLAQLLNTKGIESGVLCRRGSFASKRAKDLNLVHFDFRGPHVFSYPKIKRWISQEKWTILHAHTGSMHTLAWLLGRRLPGVAIVRTRGDARKVKKKMFYDRILEATRFFIFPTKLMRDEFLVAFNYPIRRAKVIYPAIEPPAVLSQAENGLCVVMVGRLDPVKGHKDFLQAAALLGVRFPQASFEIVGAQKNTPVKELRALARRLGIEPRIKLRGYLSDDQLHRTMSAASIGVIASRGSEVISRVCLEWMSLGKPIVATKVGMIPELVQDGRSGILVAAGSYEEMSYGLKKLLASKELRLKMGRQARELYAEKFAPTVCFEKHLNLYKYISQ